MSTPFIVGIGGTVRPDSSSEIALRVALEGAAQAGARTRCFSAVDLDLPFYDPKSAGRVAAATALVEALRAADGVVISSPGYHGGVSGLIKNALDYVEDMVHDERVYLSDLPIGCIGVAYGSQAAVSVLAGLRAITHALRGFPTPYGASVVASPGLLSHGTCNDAEIRDRLLLVGTQVADFARAGIQGGRAVITTADLSAGSISSEVAGATPVEKALTSVGGITQ